MLPPAKVSSVAMIASRKRSNAKVPEFVPATPWGSGLHGRQGMQGNKALRTGILV